MFKTMVPLLVFFFTLTIPGLMNAEAAGSPKTVITGTISKFDCEGEPCLLTVIDGKGMENDGICSDSLCDKWNKSGKMPAEFKGRKVKVTVEKSQGGHGRGSADEFLKIELLK
jgi:hypothetical protein